MLKFLLSSIVVTVLLSSSTSFAQSLSLDYQGKPGVWMPQDMAQRLLADVRSLDLVKLEVGELKLQLNTRMERIEALKEALKQSEIAESKSAEALSSALAERDKARADLKKWYRHPALWVSVGIVLTVVLEVIAIKSVEAASD